LYMQSLELRKKLLGEEHPDVATSLNNLAFLYESQRKYEAAEPLYMQSLELRKKLLGEEHPDVATSLNNLADLYKSQGKYEDAEPLFLQSLELRKKLLGQEHPDVATSLNNLAILYYLQGKYETAEPLFLQSLELSQKLLGEEHPYVANTLNNLANLYELQGKDEAAETLYHQSLELSQKLLGTARPETLYQALELSKNLLRQEGTETKIIRKNLANLQHKIQNSLSFLDRFIFLERFISIFNPLEPKIQIRSNMNPDLQAQTPKKPYYLIIHKRIRNRIAFHASYTFILGIWYQVLRYSIPVISGSLAAIVGTHQLSSETIVIWTSMVITFLGTLNSVISPSESYEWTVIFASQFENFLCDFDLKFQEIQDKGEEEILNFLNQQNKELSTLIDRFNKFPKHSDR
ncbi:MAG: tetratricopeptide repeat protein, partial [Spirulina sp.]